MAIASKGFVSKKRSLINKANQWMLISVILASMVLGVSGVAINYLARMIGFQATVIGEKEAALEVLKTSLDNYTKLRQSVAELNDDAGLIAVAENHTNTDEYIKDPLRIVSNSLPPYQNLAALGSSIDYLLLQGGDGAASVEGIGMQSASSNIQSQTRTTATRMNFSFNALGELGCGDAATKCTSPRGLSKLIDNLERSIRFIDINSAYLRFKSTDRIEFGAQASAYYSGVRDYILSSKKIYASEGSK